MGSRTQRPLFWWPGQPLGRTVVSSRGAVPRRPLETTGVLQQHDPAGRRYTTVSERGEDRRAVQGKPTTKGLATADEHAKVMGGAVDHKDDDASIRIVAELEGNTAIERLGVLDA